jgi:hypothetical protein
VPQNGSNNQDSLIDFGDDNNDAFASAQSTMTPKSKNSAAMQGLLDESSDENPQSPSGGRARQSSLMEPLQPTLSPQHSNTVRRVDSTNSDLDEFVDAQG